MPVFRFVIPLVMSFLLVACESSDAEPIVRIQLFGDSLMRGYLAEGDGVRAAMSPEQVLSNRLDSLYGSGVIRVETRATDGLPSGRLVAGTDGLNLPWPQSVDADIVVINHGANDVSYQVSDEEYEANLRILADSPATVVFQTPTIVSTRTRNLAPIMRTVAEEKDIPVLDVYAYVETVPDWYANYAPDGIHYNDEGYRLVTESVVVPGLRPLIDKVLAEK